MYWRKTFKQSAKYLFSIFPLGIIFVLPGAVKTVHRPEKALKITAGLPCGFVAKNLQDPDKPTFLTNNDIPILLYPAGNYPGTNFQVPDAAYTPSKNDQLILQPDGNLVIYCTSCTPSRALWSSQTNGKGAIALFFQTDGDLVLKDAYGKTVWHSNIKSKCPGSEAVYYTFQDDGNLVMLYDETVGSKQITAFLGSTGSSNNQTKSPHPGKIQ